MKLQVAAPIGILVLAVGGALGWVLHDCPEPEPCVDHWPHKAHSKVYDEPQGSGNYKTCYQLLESIVNKGLQDVITTTDPTKRAKIRLAIQRALICASADDIGSSDPHVGAVDRAYTEAFTNNDWGQCATELDPVNHPH